MLAIIGGSGLSSLDILEHKSTQSVDTPYSDSPVEINRGEIEGYEILFLPRHGTHHRIPPHRVNYRANVWALKHMEVSDIIAINAVGAITPQLAPGQMVIPDQIIDYTHGRAHTFYEDNLDEVVHVDFTNPYSNRLRQLLIVSAEDELTTQEGGEEELPMTFGVYGCVQGPRLESAAEIERMSRDGCDMVGMTGMPEAGLARELGIRYACLGLTVNRAAGLDGNPITMDAINLILMSGIGQVKKLLRVFLNRYREQTQAQSAQ